jgi:predicted  nucleic acid-binding Zn-ribbon protein
MNAENRNLEDQLKILREQYQALRKAKEQDEARISQLIKELENAKESLSGDVRRKDEAIEALNKQVEDRLRTIEKINKQLLQASAELIKAKEAQATNEKQLEDQIKSLKVQNADLLGDLQGTKQTLSSLTSEYQAYIKKKETEEDVLNARLRDYASNHSQLR